MFDLLREASEDDFSSLSVWILCTSVNHGGRWGWSNPVSACSYDVQTCLIAVITGAIDRIEIHLCIQDRNDKTTMTVPGRVTFKVCLFVLVTNCPRPIQDELWSEVRQAWVMATRVLKLHPLGYPLGSMLD